MNVTGEPGGKRTSRVRAVDEGVPDDRWRRVHPVSPVLNAWKALAAVLAILVWQNADTVAQVLASPWASSHGRAFIVVIIVAGLAVFLLIAGVYSWLAWRATSYAVTDDAVWFRSGILFRSQRHARLDRVQAVDLVHPLLGRVFGLGRLNVEVAGGSGSNLSIGYLTTPVLEDLRAEILARAAGVYLDSAGTHQPDADGGVGAAIAGEDTTDSRTGSHTRAGAPVADERPVYDVSTGMLLGSLFLSVGVMLGIIATVALVVGIIVAVVIAGPGVLLAAWAWVPMGVGLVSYVWGRFSGEFGFHAAVSADGIRIRRGLTESRSQTIPPRRVHAVRVVQPLLWRRRGWYRVTIAQAGYGRDHSDASSTSSSTDVLLPVGTRREAELALWLVIRDLGVEDPIGFIQAGLFGTGADHGFLPNPESSRLFDPWVRRRRGVALTETVLAVRDGRLSRELRLAPVERLQSVAVEQGPWQRKRGLATLHMHVVPGPVRLRAVHVDAEAASALLERLLPLSRVRRASEPPEKWMMRVSSALDRVGVPEAGVEGTEQ